MDALTALIGNNTWLLILLLVWVLPWKGVALWKAAMREDKWWFIIIFIVNTFGILDIFYIFFIAKRHDDMQFSDHEHEHDHFDENQLGSNIGINDDAIEEVEDGSESEAVDEEAKGAPFEHESDAHKESDVVQE